MGNGNAIAHLALLCWLPLSIVVASLTTAVRAYLIIVIGGALLLPERLAFDFPLLPPLDKHAIATLSATIALAVTQPACFKGPLHSRATFYFLVLIMGSTTATVLTNRDPLFYGPVVLPGLSNHDLLAALVADVIRVVLPFYLAQTLIRTMDDLRELLRGLVIAALLYIPFILLEVRLSPIFHEKIYGFFQHEFIQAMRAGGFRAFVFMSHGLAVAFFISQAVTITFAMGRFKRNLLPVPAAFASVLLAVTLITCKSMGAFIYAILSVLLLWFVSLRNQLRFARWLSLGVFSYPLARAFDLLSTEWMLEKASAFSEERAGSLAFRFHHEGELLLKAQERVYFGWGTWGRNHVFDPETGRNLTVVDGEWILQLGTGGALRFLLIFGVLLLPVFGASKAFRRVSPDSDDARILTVMAVLLALTGLDLVPNSISHPLPYVMAGALASVCAGISKVSAVRAMSARSPLDRTPALPQRLRSG